MLNVLRVNCSATMNEDAKSAVENFAAHLRTVLEQYENLWEHYTQLNQKYDDLKHSVDLCNKEHCNGKTVNSNLICKKHTNENSKDAVTECFKSKFEEKTSNIPEDEESDSINEHMLSVSMSDFESDLECDISAQSKALAKELQTEMLIRSPVMSKGRKKSRLKNVQKKCLKGLYKNQSSDSSNNHLVKANLFEKGSNQPLENRKHESQRINKELRSNNSQASELEFTISRNVETLFPQAGKKMKQSKLLLSSPQKIKDVTLFDNSDDKCHLNNTSNETTCSDNDNVGKVEILKTPEKSLHKPIVFNPNKVETEDIIESTPGRCSPHSVFKSRLMLKRNVLSLRQQPTKVPDCKKENLYTTESDAQSPTRSSTPLRENARKNNNSRPLSLRRNFSKINDVLTSGNVSEGYGTMTGNERESRIDEPLSPMFVHLDDTCMDTQTDQPVQKSVKKSSDMPGSEFLKPCTIPPPIQDSTLLDDTFFEPEEERIRYEETNENYKKRNTSHQNMLPPPKRLQLDTHNISHKGKGKSPQFVYKTGTVRNKVERAKLNGWSCWECKQYYGDLGLSEKELEMRKKQCSRHKAVFDEWRSTPDGFWNHVFPDTMSSSCEDN